MLYMLPFPSNGENSAHGDSKLSSNGKGDSRGARKTVGRDSNMFLDARARSPSMKVFEFSDLRRATQNFSPHMLLDEGSFGKVFLGWVDKNTFGPSSPGVGIAVAVKRNQQESIQGHAEWQAELSFLGQLAHFNVISLLGYCSEEEEHLLVYEYMQNGSYDRALFRNIAEPLSWGTRLKITIGVARGLAFLHSSISPVIYRDLKCSHILLDQDFNAKLGDFSLARCGPENLSTHVSTRVLGTYGYAAREYITTGHLSVKSDIYGFGSVLLETLTGISVHDLIITRSEEWDSLVESASPILARKEKLKKLIDPRLERN